MNKLKTILTISVLAVVSSGANAALESRLGGLAYYDTEADLTWLADANYAQTSGYVADGGMEYVPAIIWAAGLSVGGNSDWRLPTTLQPDASCDDQSGSVSSGYNCTGSEMGSLFYTALGNSAGLAETKTGPFSNVQISVYWSATEYAPNTSNAWHFSMNHGFQNDHSKALGFYAWAVQSGDVSAVPVPAAAWLFGSALLGLVGLGKRKR